MKILNVVYNIGIGRNHKVIEYKLKCGAVFMRTKAELEL